MKYQLKTFSVPQSQPEATNKCTSVSHFWVLGQLTCQCGKQNLTQPEPKEPGHDHDR